MNPFPHPCTDCGLCCIAVVCPLGQDLMRVPKQGPCPALEWEGDKSRCGLVANPAKHLPEALVKILPPLKDVIGSGKGCCMSARVMSPDGTMEDFASLPEHTKIRYTRSIRGLPTI